MPSVLIVDPDPVTRDLARRILEAAGVVCFVGDDVHAAVSLATLNQPDGVILDIGRALEGIEATRVIKSELPRTKVVLLTSHDEEAYLAATGKTGADALLPKRALRQVELLVTTVRGLGREFLSLWDGRDRRHGWPGSPRPWDGTERRRHVAVQRIEQDRDDSERPTN